MIFRTFFALFMSVAVLGILLVNVYPVSEFEQVEEYPEYHSGWMQWGIKINQTTADMYNDYYNTSLEDGDSIMSYYFGTQHMITKQNAELCNSDAYAEASTDEIKQCLRGEMNGNFSDPVLSSDEKTELDINIQESCEANLDSLYESDRYQDASKDEKEKMEDEEKLERDNACSILTANVVTWYGSYAAIVFCSFSAILCTTTTFNLTGKKLCGFTLLLSGLIIMAYSGHYYYHILEISSNLELMASYNEMHFEADPGVTLFFNAGAGLSSFIMSIFVFRAQTDDDDW